MSVCVIQPSGCQSPINLRYVMLSLTSMRDSLTLAEGVERDRLLEECALDPTVFDKTSIITRSYQNKKRVSGREDAFLLFSVVYMLNPFIASCSNCCCSKGPAAPYWSNPPFFIFDIRTLWRSVLSARVSECQQEALLLQRNRATRYVS